MDKTGLDKEKTTQTTDPGIEDEAALCPARSALRVADILRAVNFAAERFLKADWDRDLDLVLEQLGRAVDASRAYIFQNSHSPQGVLMTDQTHEWTAEGVAPQMGQPFLHSISYEELGATRWVREMRVGNPICGCIKDFPASEHELFESQDIQSLVAVPIRVHGEFWGFFGFDECRFERDWLDSEIDALQTAASILGAAIEMKSNNKALRESEERFRHLVENLPQIFYRLRFAVMAADFVSPQMPDLIGYCGGELSALSRDELLDLVIHPGDRRLFRPMEELPALFRQGLEQKGRGFAVRTDFRVVTKSGDIRYAEDVATPWLDDEGNLIGNTGVITDITDRVLAEQERNALREQLIQSQKMEALGALAGGMAHDFNNILAVIMGAAEIAMARLQAGDPVHKKLESIVRSARSARDISLKLLTFARKEKLDVKVADINLIVADIVDILERSLSKKVMLKLDLDPGAPRVRVDANQMQQALMNIILNAGDAMPEGGVVTVSTGAADPDDPRLRLPGGGEGNWCRVCIADTGPGVDEEIADKIFDPFFTTKEKGKGTGLGLSITLGIVRNHGGFIDVRSDHGGTEAAVFLPAVESREAADAARAQDAAAACLPPGRGGTILVVDDDPDFLEIIIETIRLIGYEPLGVGSGSEALEIVRGRGRELALIVLDMLMPGMDGAEVFKALKEECPQVRVLICSGFSLDGQAGDLLLDGADAYLQKPFSIDELCNKIREVIEPG